MGAAADRARAELLATFAWTAGHADFATSLRSPELLAAVGPALVEPFRAQDVSAVIGLEARGFVFAALAAEALGVGLVLARKPGSVHPDAEAETARTPDWRGRRVEVRISRSSINAGDRLLLVDDWIQTGSQARAVASLVRRLRGNLIGVSALVDDTTDDVRSDLNVRALVRSTELPAN